jgi:hypothetical protein
MQRPVANASGQSLRVVSGFDRLQDIQLPKADL